jgi:hypothetical protein
MKIFDFEKASLKFLCLDNWKNVNSCDRLKLRIKIFIYWDLYLTILFRLSDRSHLPIFWNDKYHYLHSTSTLFSTFPSEDILPLRGNFYNKSLSPIKVTNFLIPFILFQYPRLQIFLQYIIIIFSYPCLNQ